MKKKILLLSCEHAVNTIPEVYKALFYDKALLETHRGIDFGAKDIADYLQKFFGAFYFKTEVSRLLIDCNRSLHHKAVFSEFTKNLKGFEKKTLIDEYYLPYRNTIFAKISELVTAGYLVIHVSQHSFTPILNEIERKADIGLLYDPRKKEEQAFAKLWRLELKKRAPDLRVRMNYPYLGINDGFITFLRKRFQPDSYLGFEVEVNQALVQEKQAILNLAEVLAQSLKTLIN